MRDVANSASIPVYYRTNKYEVPQKFVTGKHSAGKKILMRNTNCGITKGIQETTLTLQY
ncbi:hypothetical protein CUR178_07575 [Leishmania enriettii]|uniref:Uncharacterized protein n=1 Tax=Leishmania enriettii TaxID=5663 RepID=A0A836GQP4_LEIEN|nr:hypothetical protein CUR178_03296 [Leishmania enriettii]KAG5485981.1 hypothetical protein CUR178_07575 [Leishmania enriettii]